MRHPKKSFRRLINLNPMSLICLAIFACFTMVTVPPAMAAAPTHSNSAIYHASPPFISRGVTPNVLIIIDNSNSMDEDIVGNAIGSAAPNSRSEIARQAIISLIDANSDKMRFGLMAYEQSGVVHHYLHNSPYYCSYDPTTYNPSGTPTPKDPSTNTLRFPNPTNPGHYVYYDQALPMYASGNYGNAFAYCSNFVEDNDGSTDNYYWAYRIKTGDTDPPSGSTKTQITTSHGYATHYFDSYFQPTDEDIAAGFTEFGEQLCWFYTSETWFKNSSPGGGHLHVAVDDSTTTHLTALHDKLGTSNFSTTASDHPNNDLDTPLRNAGLTPIEGTLESCRNYFEGTSSPVTNWCQKNFIILVTDGLPSVDKNGAIGDADALLPGVKSEVQSLRATSVPGYTDDFDIQTFVLGFALPSGLGSKLDDIAVAGGTDDNGHAYIAGSQAQLATALQKIFLEILNRASSGSAASVISNSRSGEGAIYQSIFFPEINDSSSHTVSWTGDVHALLVDKYGNMREDTNDNQQLDEASDKFVVYYDDPVSNTTKVKLYSPVDASSNLLKEPDTTSTPTITEITDLNYLWSGLDWLSNPALNVTSQRTYANTDNKRYIFTDFIDTSKDISMTNVDNEQVMDFLPDFVNDPVHDNYFFLNPEYNGMTEAQMITEAQNIINFTRGQEGLSNSSSGTDYRNRTLVDSSGNNKIYRLGDIIHSTPTVVSCPTENYDLIYNDSSYLDFKSKYSNRRMVVYSGANDGMLHAFNGGFYDKPNKAFITAVTGKSAYPLGMELWAYVPNSLLPHLRWLTEASDYNSHVYYVDLKPRIFDAKIFTNDAVHPGGWGTVLLGGMRLGGGDIGVDTTNDDGTDDLQFTSTYFALDITDPESPPTKLWSFTDANLGFTTCYPTPIRVGSKWFIIIGSGPVNYSASNGSSTIAYGGSNRTADVYILNADDGTTAHTFAMDSYSFMSDPIAADFDLVTTGSGNNLKWSGEAIYIGSDGIESLGSEEGQIFRIKTTKSDGSPEEDPSQWVKTVFFNPNSATADHQHINTALSIAKDDIGRLWVYFGTGRYWSTLDRTGSFLSYQNAFYGIKEPVDANTGELTYGTVSAKATSLKNVTGIEIVDHGTYNTVSGGTDPVVDENSDGNINFDDLLAEVQAKEGWYRNFSTTGERNLGQATILGDIVTFSTFIPSNDPCGYEGDSNIYGLYYKTGTAYWKGVLITEDYPSGTDNVNKVLYKLSAGKGYSTTPNLHTGENNGSKAFLQTSTGAIIGIKQNNPGATKSGGIYWMEKMEE